MSKMLILAYKAFTKQFFDQIPCFAISKMAKNQFFCTGKAAKNTLSRNFYLFILFHEFFLPILNFLARCENDVGRGLH